MAKAAIRIGLCGKVIGRQTEALYKRDGWNGQQEFEAAPFFNPEYEFIPLFDSWTKITSAIMIIKTKITLLFFNPSVTVFSAEKCLFLHKE